MWGVDCDIGRQSSFVMCLLTTVQKCWEPWAGCFFLLCSSVIVVVLSCKKVLASACLEDYSRGPS